MAGSVPIFFFRNSALFNDLALTIGLAGKYFFAPPENITPRNLVMYLNEVLAAAGRQERVDLKVTTREDFVQAKSLFDSVPGAEEMWGKCVVMNSTTMSNSLIILCAGSYKHSQGKQSVRDV